jgi:RHS repeat-associated protein
VLSTVSDRRLAVSSGSVLAYYRADEKSYADYDPYGMLLPGRFGGGFADQKFGFQGQLKDDELNSSMGTTYAFEYRMYDPRVGRFFSIDPLVGSYPSNSSYAFSENNVIRYIELEGLEKEDPFVNTSGEASQIVMLRTLNIEQEMSTKTKARLFIGSAVTAAATSLLVAAVITFSAGLATPALAAVIYTVAAGVAIPEIGASYYRLTTGIDYATGHQLSTGEKWQEMGSVAGSFVGGARGAELGFEGAAIVRGRRMTTQGLPEPWNNTPDVLYRRMSEADIYHLSITNRLRASSETCLATEMEYSATNYANYLVRFNLRQGTIGELGGIGGRHNSVPNSGNAWSSLPPLEYYRNWTLEKAMFKMEDNQLTIGLGKGKALELFNKRILSYDIIKIVGEEPLKSK